MGSAPPTDDVLRSQRPLVVAAELCERVVGTNFNPPRARVRLLDVIHGTLSPGEHVAFFSPPSDAGFYAMRAGAGVYETWKTAGYASPDAGAQVIFAADIQEGVLVVWPRTLRPDSAAERARLRALFADGA
jgi:hypothetical protein